MKPRPVALIVPLEIAPSLAALLIVATCVASAAAWKSPVWIETDPLKPVPPLMSTKQLPWVVNGLAPVSEPRFIRSVADVIVAPSGIDEVSNDRMVLYWRSVLS